MRSHFSTCDSIQIFYFHFHSVKIYIFNYEIIKIGKSKIGEQYKRLPKFTTAWIWHRVTFIKSQLAQKWNRKKEKNEESVNMSIECCTKAYDFSQFCWSAILTRTHNVVTFVNRLWFECQSTVNKMQFMSMTKAVIITMSIVNAALVKHLHYAFTALMSCKSWNEQRWKVITIGNKIVYTAEGEKCQKNEKRKCESIRCETIFGPLTFQSLLFVYERDDDCTERADAHTLAVRNKTYLARWINKNRFSSSISAYTNRRIIFVLNVCIEFPILFSNEHRKYSISGDSIVSVFNF